MKRRRPNRAVGDALFLTTGWLFADLFVALAMGFLVANTFVQVVPPAATPTARPTSLPTATATPAVLPGLEQQPIVLTLSIDYQGILDGKQAAINDAENLVQANAQLQGRRAGLILTFGGSAGHNEDFGANLASVFNNEVLVDLGNKGFVFYGSPVYRNFHDLGTDPGTIEVDVYVFRR